MKELFRHLQLRLGVAALGPVQPRKVVEALGDIGVVGSERLFDDAFADPKKGELGSSPLGSD